MAKRDYYEILGVDKSSSQEEIKKAYRKVAIKYHPDKNPGDKAAEDQFKEAAEAYEILSNPEKRQRYDRFGHQGVEGGHSGHGNMNMDDIFSQFGDIFGGGGFGDIFGGGGGRAQRMRKGTDLRIKLKLTLEEAAQGVEKKIKIKRQAACNDCSGNGSNNGNSFENCTTCQGTGQIRRVTNTMLGQMVTSSTCSSCQGEGKRIKERCKSCGGDGIVPQEEVISIKIPAGVSDGMQLAMGGKGNFPPRGGVPGDLLIVIEEETHEFLRRDGKNIHFDLYISFPDAALGTSVEVPTLEGPVRITIEPGAQSGKVLRLRGKGITDVNRYGKGDQFIHVNVWTPQELNKEERKILEKLKSSENFCPNPTKGEKSFLDKMREFFQ